MVCSSLAEVMRTEGDLDGAVQLFGAAEKSRETSGAAARPRTLIQPEELAQA